jgi:hypothetical protein
MKMTRNLALVGLGLLIPLSSVPTGAQDRSGNADRASRTGEMSLTASSANVSQPGNPIQINILRWSTEEERRLLVSALNPPPSPAASPAASSGSLPREVGVAAPHAEVEDEGVARRLLRSVQLAR